MTEANSWLKWDKWTLSSVIFVAEIRSWNWLSLPHKAQQKAVEMSCSPELISVDCVLLFNISFLVLQPVITARL